MYNLQIENGEKLPLPKTGTWPESVHVFEQESIWALKAALSAERPLLIRGEPGCGKSQLARAAAVKTSRALVTSVVHSRSESRDLLYNFDAVARLGEAQTLAACKAGECDMAKLDYGRFLSPGPLWWAFDWESAKKQSKQCASPVSPPEEPTDWSRDKGTVFLLDEIDKADADLPNGLLETLGNGAFSIPMLNLSVGLAENSPAPLVIITTNEERELPAAFLRRCLVLHMALPEDDRELMDYLISMGEAHFGDTCSPSVKEQAAEMLCDDRRMIKDKGRSAPGLAEYLDMLRSLGRLGRTDAEQEEALQAIARFALQKHPPEMI